MNGQSLTDPDPIVSEWLGIAVSYAQGRGFTFTKDCLADLQGFFNGGAVKLRTLNQEASAGLHSGSIEQLVNLMINQLQSEAPGTTELREWTFLGAVAKFCPIFPFC